MNFAETLPRRGEKGLKKKRRTDGETKETLGRCYAQLWATASLRERNLDSRVRQRGCASYAWLRPVSRAPLCDRKRTDSVARASRRKKKKRREVRPRRARKSHPRSLSSSRPFQFRGLALCHWPMSFLLADSRASFLQIRSRDFNFFGKFSVSHCETEINPLAPFSLQLDDWC